MLVSLAAAGSARADIFATFDSSTFISQLRSVNAVTGAAASLPPGVNDPSANEQHPALSRDGRFLVSVRRTFQGTVRILLVERATGRSADLFNAFEAASDQPTTPTFSLDGTKVITGRPLDRRDPGSPPGALQSSFTETDVTSFPTGPFPHKVVLAGGADSTAAGRALQPVPFGANLLAFGIEYASGSPPGRITVQDGAGATTLSDPAQRFANPAISESAGVVVFESAPAADAFRTKLVFRPLDGFATSPTTSLPALVNKFDTAVSNPAFTRDGRYLAFKRRDDGGHGSDERIFLWDTQTQLLLNPNGVKDAGPSVTVGAIALEVRRVFTTTTILASGSLGFSLASGSTTGLLVQRIVGRHKVLGRTAPKLKRVGRVPLGRFGKGRHRKHWKLTVRGHRLRRGCYLVTFRALTRGGKVRDLSKPYTVRVRKHKRPRVRRGVRLRTCRGTRR